MKNVTVSRKHSSSPATISRTPERVVFVERRYCGLKKCEVTRYRVVNLPLRSVRFGSSTKKEIDGAVHMFSMYPDVYHVGLSPVSGLCYRAITRYNPDIVGIYNKGWLADAD